MPVITPIRPMTHALAEVDHEELRLSWGERAEDVEVAEVLALFEHLRLRWCDDAHGSELHVGRQLDLRELIMPAYVHCVRERSIACAQCVDVRDHGGAIYRSRINRPFR